MRNRSAVLLLLSCVLLPVPASSFIRIESMPYTLLGEDVATIYWEDSYRITVDDMQVQLVYGSAQISGEGMGVKTINWDPEIVSILLEDDEIMRRTGIGEVIVDDPIARMPFLGIGGVVSPTNGIMGIEPLDAPESSLTWDSQGEDGLVRWRTSFEYSAGDRLSWLNRTFALNASILVDCEYEMTSEYRALSQKVTVTNGNLTQRLPFPLESSFSLGSNLKERAISLPDMNLTPDRYFIYPERSPPPEWHNETLGGLRLPAEMWEEDELPGMIYVEFDLPSDRNWYGMSTVTDIIFDLQAGAGVKVISTEGMNGFRPYCILVSGPSDHVLFGFKPFESQGAYDKFVPLRLGPGESVSLDLLWFFPEPEEESMSVEVFESFAQDALSVSDFHSQTREAANLFGEANDLAAEGRIDEALEKADLSLGIYAELGRLSSSMFEEGRTINATKHAWITAAAQAEPHTEREGRPAIYYSTIPVLIIILVLLAWIYVIEPRRAHRED